MERLVQWFDDLDDLVATVRLLAPSLLPAIAVIIVTAAITACGLWLPVATLAVLAGSVALLGSAIGIGVFLRRISHRSLST